MLLFVACCISGALKFTILFIVAVLFLVYLTKNYILTFFLYRVLILKKSQAKKKEKLKERKIKTNKKVTEILYYSYLLFVLNILEVLSLSLSLSLVLLLLLVLPVLTVSYCCTIHLSFGCVVYVLLLLFLF